MNVPSDHIEDGLKLGYWVSNQRAMNRKKRLPQERIKQLEALGFAWNSLLDFWERNYAELIEFKKREGHTRVSRKHIVNGLKLGYWVSHQKFNKHKMSQERLNRLLAINFEWSN